jgi:hypothetical protein
MRVLRKKERNKGLKNWKAKLSMLMVLCLVLTGSHGLVLSADAQEEQGGSPNRIESRGDNVKLHFKGEDLRQAAEAAIYEGVKFSITESLSYSKDPELLQLYRDSLAEGKELYEISLDNFVNGTEAVYQETGAKVRAIVEIDPTERTGEIEKQGKDALGFFTKDSSFGKLMEQGNPDWYEEALAPEREKERLALEKSEADKAKEEKAAQSQAENAEQVRESSEAKQGTTESKPEDAETEKEEASTENKSQEEILKEVENAKAPDFINLDAKKEDYVVQGTELIHFLYENHGEQDLRFQLFVDSNSYPGVNVQSKAKLAKSILEDVKSLEDKIKKTNAKKDGEEQEVKQNTEALPSTEQSNESLVSSEESQTTELTTATVAGQGSETLATTEESKSTEDSASVGESQEQSSVVITEVKGEEENKKEKVKNSQENPILALYQEMKEDITPFLSELYTAKYQIYSLNELGRKSQHKELDDFGVVEVFYDKEAFPEAVTLQVSKMVKPEEAKGDESKLSDAQVEALKVRGYYEDSRSIDIHFVNAEGVEVEPTLPVAVRISISKDTLPEEAKPENIAIHHLVEEEGSDKIAYVETVSDTEKNAKNVVEENAKATEELTKKEETEEETKPEEKEKKEIQSEEKNDKAEKNAYIVREFNVKSFSVYTISWSNKATSNKVYKFYYLDGDFRQIGPSVSVDMSAFEKEAFLYQDINYPLAGPVYKKDEHGKDTSVVDHYEPYSVYNIYPNIPGYTRHDKVYPSYSSLEEIQTTGDREAVSWGNEVYFMSSRYVVTKLNYYYFEHELNRDFGPLVNMTTWDKNYKDPYYPDRDVCAGYYYFFYTLDKKPHDHTYTKRNMTMEQEKYITKLADGSYDITLTAKPVIEGGEKNQLDLIIVYDKSYYMGFPFDEKFTEKEYQDEINTATANKGLAKAKIEAEKRALEKKESSSRLDDGEKNRKQVLTKILERLSALSFPDNDSDKDKRVVNNNSQLKYLRSRFDPNRDDSMHTRGKQLVRSLVDDLSKNPAYDVQFALVAMGGQRTLNVKNTNSSDHSMELNSITDTPYNDAEKLIGFTKDVNAFKAKLNSIQVEDSVNGGLNYAAGLKGAVEFQNGETVGANTQSIREHARRVVLFISSHDPNFSYFDDLNTDKNGGFQDFYFLNGVSNMVGNKRVFGKVPGKVEDKGKVDVSTSSAPNANATIEAYSFKTSDFKDGYSYGSGVGYEQSAFTQARAELAKLNKIDAFYTWGLGQKENYSQLEKLTKKSPRWMISGHPEEQPLDDSIEQENFKLSSIDETQMRNKKNEIRNTIAPIHINLFRIWDRLSENVELNFDYNDPVEKAKKLRLEIWKLDSQGKPSEVLKNPTNADGFSGFIGLEERYDAAKRTIEMYNRGNFFAFPEGFEYHLTVNVKPTLKAYEKYQKNFMEYFDKENERIRKAQGKDIGYLDDLDGDNTEDDNATFIKRGTSSVKQGDIRTDQWYLYQKTPEEQFHTSSQKDGFYSNEGAYLIYQRFRGKNDPEQPKNKYQKPVIQIEPASLRVVKTFQGTNSSTEELELLKNTSFLLEEEKVSGSGNFEAVKRFSMTKSETDSSLGYLVSEELKGTSLSGTGKNLTPTKPAGTLQTVMNGGMKQYVLSINGLVPGRKYRVSEILGSKGENPVVEGSQFHFKKMEVTAGADSKTAIGGGKSEYAIVTMGKNETKEIKVQNTYEGDGKRALRIEKRTSGEMADTNQSFPFQLKLVKANGQAINQSDFNTLKASFSAETKGVISFSASNSAISFNLKHGQGLEFILPKDLSFSVGENPSGYLPSVSTGYVLQQATDAQGFRFTKARKIKDIPGTAKIVLQFHNVKDPISPTGVVDEVKPLAMVFTAFILFSGAIAFGMKKKEEF